MESEKKFFEIIFRYIILAILAFGNLWLIYEIFTPLTFYPVLFILGLFFTTSFSGITIYINSIPIEIVEACIAGSAYYLLLMFNLSTPNIEFKKRLKMILSTFLIFLFANVLRIVLLSIMYEIGSPWFDVTHKVLWYMGSTILVLGIWFYQVKSQRIKDIPFYSDLKFLYNNSIKKLLKSKK